MRGVIVEFLSRSVMRPAGVRQGENRMRGGSRAWARCRAAVALAGMLGAFLAAPVPAALADPGAVPPGWQSTGPWGLTLAQPPQGSRPAALRSWGLRPGHYDAPGLVAGPVSDSLGEAVAVSGRTAVVGAVGVNNSAGAVYVYHRQGTRWGLQAVLTDPRNVPDDLFGASVALAGGTVLIGAIGVSKGAGAAYVYVRSGTRWSPQAAFTDPRGLADDRFGNSVALAGPTVLVGALGVRQSAGAAYAYERSGRHWHLQAVLTDPPDVRGDEFGFSVGLTDTAAVIGAWDANKTAGAAYVFSHSGTRWHLRTTLTDPRKVHGDNFGVSVAISGATVLVGAYGADKLAGAAYLYADSAAGWRLHTTLTDPGGAQYDSFGSAVALSGTTALVSAFGVNEFAGTAYLYVRSGNHWLRRSEFDDPNQVAYDFFGTAVAVSGATAIVGANDVNNTAGAAYVYAQSGSAWGIQAAVTDPRGNPGNAEGGSVAISGATAVVGAWGAHHQAGAAYIYVRAGQQWRRQFTLSDPRGVQGDLFGASVGVSGSTVIIGAWGVNFGSGAVYIYVRSGRRWRRQATIDGPRAETFYALGTSVAVSGPVAVIGADGAKKKSGQAYIYVRSGTRWHRQATLTDPGGRPGDGFGTSVALSGTSVVVGADGVHNYAGMAYLYDRSGRRWHLQAALSDPDGRPNDEFGMSVALSGTQAVIGAPGVHNFTGAAYMYSRTGTRWRQRAVLTVSRLASPAGGFGGAVAISGTGTNATALLSGLSVSGLTTARYQCGSAFEFTRPRGRWRERARVADPKCRSYDEFGYAAAISGTTALIGAPGADANAGAAYLLTLLAPSE